MVLLIWPLIEPRITVVTEVEVRSRDLPKEFDGYRIALLTDIHHGPYFSLDRVRKVVGKTNDLKVDLILLGGDYVHRSSEYIGPVFEALRELAAPDGVMGVLGNHDHWEGADQTRRAMARAGIVDLGNRSRWIERGHAKILVGGVGDLWEDKQDLDAALDGSQPRDFVILLSHNPDYVEKVPESRIDLMLCGHTHGGQVTIFGLYAPVLPIRSGQKYRSGVVMKGPMEVIVSRGLGNITPPLRFFCPPQIVIITLRRVD